MYSFLVRISECEYEILLVKNIDVFASQLIKHYMYASLQKSVSVTGQTKEIATQSARTKHVGPVFSNNHEIALMVVWRNVKILKRNKGSLAI